MNDLSKYTKQELRNELKRRDEFFYVEKYLNGRGLFQENGTIVESKEGLKLFVYGFDSKGRYVVDLLNAGYKYLKGE